MSLPKAIRSGFTKAFNYRGRASLSEFWWYILVACLVSIAWVFLIAVSPAPSGLPQDSSMSLKDYGAVLITIVWLIVFPLQIVALMVRRLHDTGHSGWLALANLIPFLGTIGLVVLWVLHGDPEANQFGLAPAENIIDDKETESSETNVPSSGSEDKIAGITGNAIAGEPVRKKINKHKIIWPSGFAVILLLNIANVAVRHSEATIQAKDIQTFNQQYLAAVAPVFTGTKPPASLVFLGRTACDDAIVRGQTRAERLVTFEKAGLTPTQASVTSDAMIRFLCPELSGYDK